MTGSGSQGKEELTAADQFTLRINSPVGVLTLISSGKEITAVTFNGSATEDTGGHLSVLQECRQELEEYFAGVRKVFTVPLQPHGTDFRMNVWGKLLEIPYGETVSYSTLAIRTGDIKNVRAVGSANGKNPVAVIIPCHRVIGANGSLVGYGGGLWRKQWLLEHEARYAKGIHRLF